AIAGAGPVVVPRGAQRLLGGGREDAGAPGAGVRARRSRVAATRTEAASHAACSPLRPRRAGLLSTRTATSDRIGGSRRRGLASAHPRRGGGGASLGGGQVVGRYTQLRRGYATGEPEPKSGTDPAPDTHSAM